MKQFFKLSRLIPLCLFLCVSLIVTDAPHFISFNTVPPVYSGDTPKVFKGASSVIYGEKGPQYASNEWKSFSTKEDTVYLYYAYYSYSPFGDDYADVKTKTIEKNNAKKLLYELSKLEPTGDTAPATPNNSARMLSRTKWIQTADKYYRIPNNQEGVIYLLNEYGDYNGEGTVLNMSDDLKLLITELYNGYGEADIFNGTLTRDNTLTVNKTFDGANENSLIVTDIVQGENSNGYYPDTNITFKLRFVAAKSGTYKLSYSAYNSGCVRGPSGSNEFEAKKGKPVELSFRIKKDHGNINFSCGGTNYSIFSNQVS